MPKFIRVLTTAERAAKKRMAKNPWRDKPFVINSKKKKEKPRDDTPRSDHA